MKFYRFKDSISACIQAHGVSFSFRNTIIGFAPDSWRTGKSRWPSIEVKILHETGQGNQRWIFGVTVNDRGFGYLTKPRPTSPTYGWFFGRRDFGHG